MGPLVELGVAHLPEVHGFSFAAERTGSHSCRVINDFPAGGVARVKIRRKLLVIDYALVLWVLGRTGPIVATLGSEPVWADLLASRVAND